MVTVFKIWIHKLSGELEGETGSEIMAAKDEVWSTKSCATKVLKTTDDRKCIMCQ
jgi:hypothetical protein